MSSLTLFDEPVAKMIAAPRKKQKAAIQEKDTCEERVPTLWDKVEPQKGCLSCKKILPLSQFKFAPRSKDPYLRSHFCLECLQLDEGEKKILRSRANYQRRRRPCESHYRSKYGITWEQYDAMKEAQGGVCAICKQPEKQFMKGKVAHLAVDHCHETGKVRGLLCSACNKALGGFRDDADILRSAADYIERSLRPDAIAIVTGQ